MNVAPNALNSLRAVALGYLPKVWQSRGWVIAGLLMVPSGLAVVINLVIAMRNSAAVDPKAISEIFNTVLAVPMLPILALIAAPAGIREEIEQRTLPLLLVRPAPVWTYPLGKGLPWFIWGALWLVISVTLLQFMGGDFKTFRGGVLGLISAWWGELALMTLLGLFFKRSTLWGGFYLLVCEPVIARTDLFPVFFRRLTFLHHIDSISGSPPEVSVTMPLFAQERAVTYPVVAFASLLLIGVLCWAFAGWKLHRTPIGIAGAEAEG